MLPLWVIPFRHLDPRTASRTREAPLYVQEVATMLGGSMPLWDGVSSTLSQSPQTGPEPQDRNASLAFPCSCNWELPSLVKWCSLSCSRLQRTQEGPRIAPGLLPVYFRCPPPSSAAADSLVCVVLWGFFSPSVSFAPCVVYLSFSGSPMPWVEGSQSQGSAATDIGVSQAQEAQTYQDFPSPFP